MPVGIISVDETRCNSNNGPKNEGLQFRKENQTQAIPVLGFKKSVSPTNHRSAAATQILSLSRSLTLAKGVAADEEMFGPNVWGPLTQNTTRVLGLKSIRPIPQTVNCIEADELLALTRNKMCRSPVGPVPYCC